VPRLKHLLHVRGLGKREAWAYTFAAAEFKSQLSRSRRLCAALILSGTGLPPRDSLGSESTFSRKARTRLWQISLLAEFRSDPK